MREPEPMYLSDEDLEELLRLSNLHDIYEEKLSYSRKNSPYVPFYSLYLSIQLAQISMQIIKLIKPKIYETEQDYASMTSRNKFTSKHLSMSLHAQNSVLDMCNRIEKEIFPHIGLNYYEYRLEMQLKRLLPIRQYKNGVSLW